MMKRKSSRPTHDEFMANVVEHKLTIFKDDGVYRHIELGKPGCGILRFGMITWPGYLTFYGDMGTFTFSRLHDMFEFFRGTEDRNIDFSYWAEKCQSVDLSSARMKDSDGIKEFSRDLFHEAVREDFDEFCLTNEVDGREKDSLWNQINNEVLIYDEDGDLAIRAVMDIYFNGMAVFPDFWERSTREYTYRFLWCCYAMRWAIGRYDAHHQTTTPTAEEPR